MQNGTHTHTVQSKITWSGRRDNPATGIGTALINLVITGGTGDFVNKKGYGVFAGSDIHASGIYITVKGKRIEVPIVRGQLKLYY